jgi:Ser/Thr protein kinase RdoA (MazF antagonist)
MDIDTAALRETLFETLGWQNLTLTELTGSTSAVLFRIDAEHERGVVRIFDTERWEEDPTELSIREGIVLEALTPCDLLTPALKATLPGGGVVMSFLAGEVNLPAAPGQQWINELAATLSRIHSANINVPYSYESWNDFEPNAPPPWWPADDLWDRAVALHRQKVVAPCVFIHRDYHPLNLLWQQDRVCGVVDWINGCMGPAHVDVSHCCLNLALMYGMQEADTFRDAYQQLNPDWLYQPYWDLDAAFGALPNPEPYPPWQEFGLAGLTHQTMQERLAALVTTVVNRGR